MAESKKDIEIRARAFWSGTITFGLVSVPVSLFPANRSTHVGLRMLSPEGHPLSRRYYCPKDDREVPPEHIVRGYEVGNGEFVVVEDEELEALEPRKTRDIDLRRFVDQDEIDPMYFERAYFLTPDGGSTKAYRLLAATMEKERKAGIATFVMRGKEYLVAILSENGILRAETLRFADEVRSPDDLGLPEPSKPGRKKVSAIEKAIDALAARKLDEDELRDEPSRALLRLVERKRRAGEDVVRAPAGAEEETEVIDLMEVLKRSLAGGGSASGRSRGEGAGRRPHRAKRRASRTGRPERRPSGGVALRDLSKKDLYERAKDLDIPGRSAMSKEELVEAVGSR